MSPERVGREVAQKQQERAWQAEEGMVVGKEVVDRGGGERKEGMEAVVTEGEVDGIGTQCSPHIVEIPSNIRHRWVRWHALTRAAGVARRPSALHCEFSHA